MLRLILAGAGHAHLGVLRDRVARAGPEADIVLINPHPRTPYSGMVPGWLAGRYGWNELSIDIAALAMRAGVKLELGKITAVKADARYIELQDGRRLDYDLLSLNLGSDIHRPSSAQGLCIRPLQAFHEDWSSWCNTADHRPEGGGPRRLAVVGAGAAGIEVLLAISHHLPRMWPRVCWEWYLVSLAPTVLPEWSARARRSVLTELKRRKINLYLGADASRLEGRNLHKAHPAGRQPQELKPGEVRSDIIKLDQLVWCSGAAAPGVLANSGLALDAVGFVRVDAALRSLSHLEVFAAGDCAAPPMPVPKSGVHAVRQGPVLARNLSAALGRGRPRMFRLRRHALALLSTGDGRAIGQWGPFSFEGAWVMYWKDAIDRRFVASHCIRLD